MLDTNDILLKNLSANFSWTCHIFFGIRNEYFLNRKRCTIKPRYVGLFTNLLKDSWLLIVELD